MRWPGRRKSSAPRSQKTPVASTAASTTIPIAPPTTACYAANANTKKPLPIPSNTTVMTTAMAPAMRESLGTSFCSRGDVVHDLAYHCGRAQPDEQPESGKHHRDVVHLADHGNEVGDDVDRRDHVG